MSFSRGCARGARARSGTSLTLFLPERTDVPQGPSIAPGQCSYKLAHASRFATDVSRGELLKPKTASIVPHLSEKGQGWGGVATLASNYIAKAASRSQKGRNSQETIPIMSLGQQLAPHLPFLRRYGRALTGSQVQGDRYVRATLEAIVAAPDQFPRDVEPRLGLYRTFQAIWNSANLDSVSSDGGDSSGEGEAIARARLAKIAPMSRQALLLTAMEGFTTEDTAYLIDAEAEEVDSLVRDALAEIERQTRARVLIIEDEPIIAMDIETIVRDLGHDVTGVAVTRDEAVALAMEDRPGLVLADIQLGDDSSGIDAVKDILAEFNVPVIFITAFPERLLTGERPEPTFLITKPFQRSTVKAAISQALFFDQSTVPAA